MNKYNTQIISLFGQPGAGKSTIAALLFARLKLMGRDVELVTEFAKKLTWHERKTSLSNQIYIHGKQCHEIEQLLGKVELIITDSPPLLSCIYVTDKYPPSFSQFVIDHYKTLPNINYYLKRVKPYNPNGRNQTEKESDKIGQQILSFLDKNSIEYKIIDGCEFQCQTILDDLKEKKLWD